MVPKWLVKWLFPRLLRGAMWLGAKAFGRFRTRKHALLSRAWMWTHVWRPLIDRLTSSPTAFDDPLAEFVYVNQACCLEDGRAKALLVGVKQAIAQSDSAGATLKLALLEELLGLEGDTQLPLLEA